MKKLAKITSAVLAATMLSASAISGVGALDNTILEDKLNSTTSYLSSQQAVVSGTLGYEWQLFGLARNNSLEASAVDGYVENLIALMIENRSSTIGSYPTANAKAVITLSSMGIDARDVDGYNLLEPLADFDYVAAQGLNGPVYTLIAFDTFGYVIPEIEGVENQTTREKLINEILANECADGGWTFYGDVADPDMTSMAITALATYYNTNEDVKTAIDKAVEVLSDMQAEDGTYASWGWVNSQSASQVVVAMSALGIDVDSDSRFTKNASLIDALMLFSVENGFSNALDNQFDSMSTEQGYYALVAYNRLLENENSLYDMYDVAPYSITLDVDNDGYVDINDSTIIQKFIVGISIDNNVDTDRFDVNNDGYVDINDATMIQKYLVNLI